MASLCTLFLLCVILLQFLIIMHLLGGGGPSPSTHSTSASTAGKLTVPCPTCNCPKCPDVAPMVLPPVAVAVSPAQQQQQHTTYEGVAITLLLHAPKWFQRRYTLMVQNVLNNLPRNWALQIFYSGEGQSAAGIELNKGLSRMIESGKVHLTLISKEALATHKKRFELMYHPWIWENMLADRVLVFGGNGVICSNSLQNISDYDQYAYIGGPWNSAKGGVGGDGGMSLRNRTLMLQVINYELAKHDHDPAKKAVAYKSWGQEDIFFVSRILEMQKKKLLPSSVQLAPREATLKFSAIGSAAQEGVLVSSGTLPGLTDKERDVFIMSCPEIKMLYPALHNPACFGATPEKDKCAESICALRPKELHKGGC